MSRALRPALIVIAAVTIAILAAACGQEKISLGTAESSSNASYKTDIASAHLFNQRCGGCHTLSYAATSGSGNNPRTYLAISGPNFNVRCERPVARVLYAIENGGFGGAYMPANIVVGQQARDIAEFVSKFAGRQAPIQPDSTPCTKQSIGSLPSTATGGVSITQTSTTQSNVSSGGPGDSSDSGPSPNN